MDLKTIDLFCGAGGLSCGFKQAGFDIVAGVEKNKVYLETFCDNHPEAEPILADVAEDLTAEEILERAGVADVDVVIGGPPCKGFSLAGERRVDDERNNLVFEFAKMVGMMRPKAFVMENVPGMLSMETPSGESVPELIKEKFEDMGYNTAYRTLNSCWYNVPQKRKRVIFIGYNNGVEPSFPEGGYYFGEEKPPEELRKNELKECRTVKDVLLEKSFDGVANHEFSNHSERMVKRMEKLRPGESLYDTWNDAWIKLKIDEPSPTVKENHNAPFVHPTEPRVVTVRECARLQSFPDDFIFSGSKSLQYKQVGNAVPPLMAKEIAKELKRKLCK